MAKNCTESEEDVTKVIHDLEEIIRNKKSDIVWLVYHQSKIFQKFRLKERFVNDMVSKFKVSKSTIVLKIALSLHYFLKKHWKLITEVCKENTNELK